MTASWLKQMGWNDVSVIRLEDVPGGRMSGPHRPRALGLGRERVATISPVDLKRRLDAVTVTLVDLEYSKAYRNGTSSAPGSQPARGWARRSRSCYLRNALCSLPPTVTSPISRLQSSLERPRCPYRRSEVGRAWTMAGNPLASGDDHRFKVVKV